MAASAGILLASALEGVAFGHAMSASSPSEDAAAARRVNKERRFAEIGAGRIAYIDRGTGPVALFLHGFPLNSFQWRGAIDRLCAHRRCVAPDLMGLGHSEVAPEQSVTPVAQGDMIAELLEHLAIPQVDLIANDSGGAVAQLFLTKHPQQVRTLLLTNCDVEINSPPAALLPIFELGRAGLYADICLETWLQAKDVARSSTALGGYYSDPGHPTDVAIDQYLEPLLSSWAREELVNRYAASLAANALAGIEPLLRQCRVPTRLVWGLSDTVFSQRDPEYLAGILPRFMGIRRIRDGKLFFPEEYPDIIAQEARRLWDQAGRSG
ncbi:MAG: alpha/beta fold hydrolase [Steroidobacteraceae bacterium]